METSTVLAAGATGLLGSEICRLPSAKNLTVKAMDRTTAGPVKTNNSIKTGVHVVQGDLRKKETLSQVLQGSTVITSVPKI